VNSSGFEFIWHWRGLANTALDVRGFFRGVKHFDHLQGWWIPKENMLLTVNEGTWIFFYCNTLGMTALCKVRELDNIVTLEVTNSD
jgi:hypothetical protein